MTSFRVPLVTSSDHCLFVTFSARRPSPQSKSGEQRLKRRPGRNRGDQLSRTAAARTRAGRADRAVLAGSSLAAGVGGERLNRPHSPQKITIGHSERDQARGAPDQKRTPDGLRRQTGPVSHPAQLPAPANGGMGMQQHREIEQFGDITTGRDRRVQVADQAGNRADYAITVALQ